MGKAHGKTTKDAIEAEDQRLGKIERDVSTSLTRLGPLFDHGALWNLPADQMTSEQAAAAHTMLKLVEDLVKARKEQLHDQAMTLAVEDGSKNDKGSYILEVEGTKIEARRSQSSSPDEKVVREELTKSRLPLSEAYDEVRTLVLNPSKLQFLVDCGKVDGTALEASKGERWSLHIHPSKMVEQLVAGVRDTFKVLAPKKK